MCTFGWVVGEVLLDCEFAPEDASFVWRTDGSLDLCLHVSDVGFIDNHLHAYLDVSKPTIGNLLVALLHLLGQQHHDLRIHLFC